MKKTKLVVVTAMLHTGQDPRSKINKAGQSRLFYFFSNYNPVVLTNSTLGTLNDLLFHFKMIGLSCRSLKCHAPARVLPLVGFGDISQLIYI
jgi:hypothetical protein